MHDTSVGSPIQIIAEIGQNHNGDMQLAKELIYAAKENGADVAKFQLYDVDSIFPKDFEWYNETKKSEVSRDQAFELAETCEAAGIEFMASVFDLERVSWCEVIQMKRYKIASRSIRHRPLIEAVAATGKDMIVSLGMWDGPNFPAIPARAHLDFLYCVAKYPTNPEDLNFNSVDFTRYSGFSDHTTNIDASLIAIARGAKILEKHFTMSKSMHGPDHSGSMEPLELAQIRRFADSFANILYHAAVAAAAA